MILKEFRDKRCPSCNSGLRINEGVIADPQHVLCGFRPITRVFYAHAQVLESLTEGQSENLDTMCLLRTLGQVKTDLVDRKLASVVDGNSQSAPMKDEAELKGKHQ